MTAAVTHTSAPAPEIEFRLTGGRLGASARVNRHGNAVDTGPDLDLAHVGSILKSVADGVRQLERELPRALAARDAAFRPVARYSRYPLSPVFGWRLPRLRSQLEGAEERLGDAVARWNADWTTLRFSFSSAVLDSCRDLAVAFQGVVSAKATWSVATQSYGSFANPLSSTDLAKQAVRSGPDLPEHVESDWPGLGFRAADGTTLTVYPGFALFSSGPDISLVSLLDISLDAREAVVAETGDPLSDSVTVRRVWERANKDGSPDRRYANNRSVAIVQYGRLRFSAPGAVSFTYLISNPHAARRFATAFDAVQRRMREEALSGAAAPTGRAAVGIAPVERSPAAVPPPPVVRGAHEYTLAALTACCIGVWMITTGAAGDRPAVAATDNSLSPPAQVVTQPLPSPDARIDTASVPVPETPAPDGANAPVALAPPVAPPRPTSPDRERIVVRTGGANIRSAPNGGADVVRTASGGAQLIIFGRASGWVRVGDVEAWGWVHSSLLEGGR